MGTDFCGPMQQIANVSDIISVAAAVCPHFALLHNVARLMLDSRRERVGV
jgi:hypothetical protein